MTHPRSRRVGVLIETLHPKDTNPNGNIFGGVIMSIMDKAAGVAAWSWAKKRVATVSADGIVFHTPIEVGEVVKTTATLIYTGTTSMVFEVVVDVENVQDETTRLGVTGFFTMVALNETGRPAPVPAWVPETDEDRAKYELAQNLRRMRQEN